MSDPHAHGEIAVKVVPADGRDAAEATERVAQRIRALGDAPATYADVNRWSEALTAALRQDGFPLAQVLMTQEDWEASRHGAQVRFTVFPGRVRAITLKNASRVDDAHLQRLITRALCGQDSIPEDCLLRSVRLERATQLLQDMPGVAIEKAPQFSPGAGVGDVNVAFDLASSGKPVQADLVADNKGMPSTGSLRFGVTGSANNLFGIGDRYALTLMATDDKMWTGALSGSVPLFGSDWRATAGFTRQQYSINGLTAITGVASTSEVGVMFPFARGLDSNIWGTASYVHSRTTTDLGPVYGAQHNTIDSLRLGVQADNGDRPKYLRANVWSMQAAMNIGHQSNDSFANRVTDVAGMYAKWTTNLFGTRAITSNGNLFVMGRVNAQLANRNLDPSEKLMIGGPDAVRAYRPDEGSFDDGAVVNLGVIQRVPVATGHQLQFGAFTDFAYGRVNHAPWNGWEDGYPGVPGVSNDRLLAGYGVSVDWLTPIGATVSVSVAKPFGFASSSWVDPGKKPVQYWLSVAWTH
ncbi:ShlB/FhaC/HecB family hemolysin secretion/activation protein [Pararobbsia silviterrae]|uniref:ShlB/FhaC/HecB family hemolysin secretion/activation protein n=1 Tax=Pararobbsia silviterrae TaxID=1792498 RepID=UPI001F0BA0C4|nr:ShlB/FhaC/HecB family hemolysin secretion/activation protein [Pararobbsia silviterrae]